jgi:hypothetical protein
LWSFNKCSIYLSTTKQASEYESCRYYRHIAFKNERDRAKRLSDDPESDDDIAAAIGASSSSMVSSSSAKKKKPIVRTKKQRELATNPIYMTLSQKELTTMFMEDGLCVLRAGITRDEATLAAERVEEKYSSILDIIMRAGMHRELMEQGFVDLKARGKNRFDINFREPHLTFPFMANHPLIDRSDG